MENKKIILWGVGGNESDGQILLNYLTMNSIKIYGVVDRDTRRQGAIVNGYKIEKPFPFYQEADYIIVTSNWIYQEICSTVKDTGIVVVDLLEMLMERERKRNL